LRARLLAEVAELRNADAASVWAHAALRHKNSLNAGDAKVVEDAFEKKSKEFALDLAPEAAVDAVSREPAGAIIDKSAIAPSKRPELTADAHRQERVRAVRAALAP
jgi:hypothetical protein